MDAKQVTIPQRWLYCVYDSDGNFLGAWKDQREAFRSFPPSMADEYKVIREPAEKIEAGAEAWLAGSAA